MVYRLRRRKVDKFSGVLGYPGTTQAFSPSISKKSRVLNTGLSSEEQAGFEKDLGLKPGALSPQVKPNGHLVSEFWRLYTLEIPPKGLDLDEANTSERLAVMLLNVSSLVVNKKGALSPKAIWEIYSDESEAKGVNVARRYKGKAFSIFEKMTKTEMSEYLTSIGKNVSNTEGDIIESLVGNDVETNAKLFTERMESPLRKDRAWLYSLLHAQVLKELSGAIYYNDIHIGIGIDDAIAFLNKPEEANQRLKISLLKEQEIQRRMSNQEPVGASTPEFVDKEQEQKKETEKSLKIE